MKLIIKVLKFIGIVFIGIVIFSIIMASFFGSNKRTEKQISKTIEKVDNEIVNNARQILEKEIVNIKPLKNYFTFSNIEELRLLD